MRNIIPLKTTNIMMGHFLEIRRAGGQAADPHPGLSHTAGAEAALQPQVRVWSQSRRRGCAGGVVRRRAASTPKSAYGIYRAEKSSDKPSVTQEGHRLWDTREVPDGIYLYELRTEAQEVLAQGKIVVKK
ncbi:MAG: hypothetical protein R3C61_14905 [Bacteroidia bacterium]